MKFTYCSLITTPAYRNSALHRETHFEAGTTVQYTIESTDTQNVQPSFQDDITKFLLHNT